PRSGAVACARLRSPGGAAQPGTTLTWRNRSSRSRCSPAAPDSPTSRKRARNLHGTGEVQPRRCSQMNWDRIQGNWKQMKGKLKEKWGKLTDDEFDQMGGHRDQLIGKIQERYGIQKDEAERQVKDWEDRIYMWPILWI